MEEFNLIIKNIRTAYLNLNEIEIKGIDNISYLLTATSILKETLGMLVKQSETEGDLYERE